MNQQPLRVTLIAPAGPGLEPLAWLDEIAGIAEMEGVALHVVGGADVTRARAARGLHQSADVVIWSGHGTQTELLLADGSAVNGKWLATQARCAAPRVLVAATCGSAVADGRLERITGAVSRAGINAVGFPLRAADPAAAAYNVELIRALAAGADVGTAHEVALESAAAQHPQTAAGITLTPALTNGYRAIMGRLDALEAGQRRLEGRLGEIAARLG
jgi:hypothetical protein